MKLAALAFVLSFLYCGFSNRGTAVMVVTNADTAYTTICAPVRAAAEAASRLAQTSLYDSAVTTLSQAASHARREYTLSFGKDAQGYLVKSAISAGNINNGSIPPISNRFADLHIHTNELPPSSGDLYGFIDQAIIDSGYIRYIITPAGKAYALVLINKQAALHFNTAYARVPGVSTTDAHGVASRYQPTFPQQLVDELNQLHSWSGLDRETAMILLLKKYNTGVALLKRDVNRNFKTSAIIEQVAPDGNKTYLIHICP